MNLKSVTFEDVRLKAILLRTLRGKTSLETNCSDISGFFTPRNVFLFVSSIGSFDNFFFDGVCHHILCNGLKYDH